MEQRIIQKMQHIYKKKNEDDKEKNAVLAIQGKGIILYVLVYFKRKVGEFDLLELNLNIALLHALVEDLGTSFL